MKLLLIAALAYRAFGANCDDNTAGGDNCLACVADQVSTTKKTGATGDRFPASGTITGYGYYCVTNQGTISGLSNGVAGKIKCACTCANGFQTANAGGCATACTNVGTAQATYTAGTCVIDTCAAGWKKTGSTPFTCVETACTGTAAADAKAATGGTVVFSNGNKHGSIATYGCAAGYKATGGTTSAYKATCAAAADSAAWVAPVTSTTCAACTSQTGCGTDGAACAADANAGGDDKLVCTTASDGYYKDTNGKVTVCAALAAPDTNAATTADKNKCTSGTDQYLNKCKAAYYLKPAVALVAATAACTQTAAATTQAAAILGKCMACSGKIAGCATATAATCSTAAGTGNAWKLQCLTVSDGYKFSGATTAILPVACADGTTAAAGAKTWKAQVAGTVATCEITACNDNWTKSLTGTATKCTKNACTAAAVVSPYTAKGIEAAALKAATTGCITTNKAEVAAVVAVGADKATDVAGLGTLGCAAGFAGTAVATCPVTGAAFVWAGCKKSSAALAQTMIGFVLTIIAMYL